MIHNIITAISSRLNTFVKNRLSVDEDVVVVRNLVDLKGNANQDIENKITSFLLSIEEDKISKNAATGRVVNNPIIFLNINVMYAAYFPDANYVESLRYVSLVIEFFQKYPIFRYSDTPGLPSSIEKLHIEIYNLEMSDTMRLWGAIGTKYVPSCAYRIKQIAFDSEMISEDIPPVMGNNE